MNLRFKSPWSSPVAFGAALGVSLAAAGWTPPAHATSSSEADSEFPTISAPSVNRVETRGVATTVGNAARRATSSVGRARLGLAGTEFGEIGSAAGEDPIGVALWGNVGWASFEDETTGFAFDSDTISGVVGGDYSITPVFRIGMAASVSRTRVKPVPLVANSDSSTDSATYGLTPYVSYDMPELLNFNVTALGSWMIGNGTVSTFVGGAAPTRSTGDYTIGGYFFDVILSARHDYDNGIGMAVALETLYANRTQGAFTVNEPGGGSADFAGTDSELGQFGFEFTPSYSFGLDASSAAELYITGRYEYDFASTRPTVVGSTLEHPNDRHGAILRAGASVFTTSGFSADINAGYMFGRENQSQIDLGFTASVFF